jgi:hypothetical protein
MGSANRSEYRRTVLPRCALVIPRLAPPLWPGLCELVLRSESNFAPVQRALCWPGLFICGGPYVGVGGGLWGRGNPRPVSLSPCRPLRSLYRFARRHFQCRRHSDLTPKRTAIYFAKGDTRNATDGRLEFITLAACVHSETSVQPTVVRWWVKLDDPHGPSRGDKIVPPTGAECDRGHKSYRICIQRLQFGTVDGGAASFLLLSSGKPCRTRR